jgi:hypothetical protein
MWQFMFLSNAAESHWFSRKIITGWNPTQFAINEFSHSQSLASCNSFLWEGNFHNLRCPSQHLASLICIQIWIQEQPTAVGPPSRYLAQAVLHAGFMPHTALRFRTQLPRDLSLEIRDPIGPKVIHELYPFELIIRHPTCSAQTQDVVQYSRRVHQPRQSSYDV